MKTSTLIRLFTLSASAAATPFVHAQVQVYGRLNVSLEAARAPGAHVGRMVNNRSVLGFKGSEDLGGGLKALFQVEGTLAPDTGAGEIARRDTRVGLEGPFGTLFAGHWTTAYNGATSGLDPFYPTTAGYMSILANGSASSTDNVADVASFDRRQANSVHWWSPRWRGWTLRATHGLAEERPASGAKPSLLSLALIHDAGPLYLALAHERHHEYHGPGSADTGSKAAVGYTFGTTRLAVVAERLAYELPAGRLARNALYVSLSHQAGRHGLRASIGRASDGHGSGTVGFVRGGADTGAVHATAGYEYLFSPRTTVYGYHTRLRNDGNAAYDFPINGVGTLGGPLAGAHISATSFGLRHSF
ncbi:porin [Pseudoduganella umbonata]|uniref:Porin n=1 Tax=Pseudoduganella umbonata TaxID=864828 RepID=A0A4P8HX76_9BURK|nr:porin [Pseudoduganella umbonata]MBB3223003.1 putative porin [Pseudoduganella umbonata]QCP13114.1 porin [Pseudoduganella umbonata]